MSDVCTLIIWREKIDCKDIQDISWDCYSGDTACYREFRWVMLNLWDAMSRLRAITLSHRSYNIVIVFDSKTNDRMAMSSHRLHMDDCETLHQYRTACIVIVSSFVIGVVFYGCLSCNAERQSIEYLGIYRRTSISDGKWLIQNSKCGLIPARDGTARWKKFSCNESITPCRHGVRVLWIESVIKNTKKVRTNINLARYVDGYDLGLGT